MINPNHPGFSNHCRDFWSLLFILYVNVLVMLVYQWERTWKNSHKITINKSSRLNSVISGARVSQKQQTVILSYTENYLLKSSLLTVQLNIFCCSFLFRQMFWGASVLQPPVHNDPRAKLLLWSFYSAHCTSLHLTVTKIRDLIQIQTSPPLRLWGRSQSFS